MKAVIDWLIPRAYAYDWNPLTLRTQETSITDLADKVIGWILLVAMILAVIYLIIAGVTYITAGGNPDAAKKGQQGIINAIIGIVIIVLAWVIANSVAGLLR